MNKIPVKQITSWSYSRYADYRQCPLKAKLKHIDKLKEPQNEAMARGEAIHKKAESFIRGEMRTLPAELKSFEKLFKEMKSLYKKNQKVLVVEDSWALKRDWSKTLWNDWNGCWLRIKLDLAEIKGSTMIITDWKTGKFRPEMNEDYMEQLELYALGAFLLYPTIDTVYPRLAYVDQSLMYPENPDDLVFTRSANLSGLLKTWERRIKPMLADKKFAPRPNDKCRWCHFRKSNGGPCKF